MIRGSIDDTIAAIATPAGEGGIGIVRLSGTDARAIAERIFIAKDGTKPTTFKTYTVHYGWVVDRAHDNKIIDEVIVSVMRCPRTYTKQDIVEINCHGGAVALRSTLDVVLAAGARMAEPGEFTKRAFLNGRIDLAQAEAVLDVIRSKTESALAASMQQLTGQVSKQIRIIRDDLVQILVDLEAHIDFPEDDIGAGDSTRLGPALERVRVMLGSLLETWRYGRMLREGISAVICGRPNVGKSSLLNAILKQERSIVTPIAGTTRDTIEEIIHIRGIPVRFVDTAGIIEPRDLIERKAVQRARVCIKQADLVLLVFDGTKRLTRDDTMFIRRLRRKKVLAVINKIDLRQRVEKELISRAFDHVIVISAKQSKNIEVLEDAIADLIWHGQLAQPESIVVTNARHVERLRVSQKYIAETLASLDNGLPSEFVSQGIKDALASLDEITGEKFSTDLLERIFSEFCIGK